MSKTKDCGLPEKQANSYAGYALHYRRGEDPCKGCLAAYERYRKSDDRRTKERLRRAIEKAQVRAFRSLHPEQADEVKVATERDFQKSKR